MPAIIIKQGREKSLLRRHPWIFSGAIHHVDDEPASGATVDLLSFNKQFLAHASSHPTPKSVPVCGRSRMNLLTRNSSAKKYVHRSPRATNYKLNTI